MPIYQVIVLAIVQGLTEFLPVSSTAHLYLTSWLLGWKTEALDFDIMLHLGTLIAVVIYFFPDWMQIIGQAFGLHLGHDEQLKQNRALLWLLAIGIHSRRHRRPAVQQAGRNRLAHPVGDGRHADRHRRADVDGGSAPAARVRDLASVNIVDACAIGLAQALAVVPGISRSGITISAGLFRNLTRESAARFSFLLSTPGHRRRRRQGRSTTCTSRAACTTCSPPSSWWAWRSAPSPAAS